MTQQLFLEDVPDCICVDYNDKIKFIPKSKGFYFTNRFLCCCNFRIKWGACRYDKLVYLKLEDIKSIKSGLLISESIQEIFGTLHIEL